MTLPSSKDTKAQQRAEALARRNALPPETRAALSHQLADHLDTLPIPIGATVSAFLPIRSEVDLTRLIAHLMQRGHKIGLPVILGDKVTMIFRQWVPGEDLVAAAFGTREPAATAPQLDPDVLLMPLAGFDARGNRLGYGAGYYDRALERMEAARPRVKIGVAFACQQLADVAAEPHDIPLDYILTENGLAAVMKEPA